MLNVLIQVVYMMDVYVWGSFMHEIYAKQQTPTKQNLILLAISVGFTVLTLLK